MLAAQDCYGQQLCGVVRFPKRYVSGIALVNLLQWTASCSPRRPAMRCPAPSTPAKLMIFLSEAFSPHHVVQRGADLRQRSLHNGEGQPRLWQEWEAGGREWQSRRQSGHDASLEQHITFQQHARTDRRSGAAPGVERHDTARKARAQRSTAEHVTHLLVCIAAVHHPPAGLVHG